MKGGTLEISEIIDLGLPFLEIKTLSSYPESTYFLTHPCTDLLEGIEYSLAISLRDLSELR